MMTTRKAKIAPSKESTSSEEIELRNQAWTDNESQSGNERASSSLISVREAPETIDNTTFIEQSDSQSKSRSDATSTHKTLLNGSTEVSNNEGADVVTDDGQRKPKIKRNTVVPSENESSENGHDTPSSRRGAWEDSTSTLSTRPSTAPLPETQWKTHKALKRRVTISRAEAISGRPITSPNTKTNEGFVGDNGGIIDNKSQSTGSQVSLLRNPFSRKTPVEEFVAEPDNNEDIISLSQKNKLETDVSQENGERTDSSASSNVLALPRSQGEQNAYIPLFYAKDYIQKVIDDMKKMKGSHLKIVDQIQEQYKMIEKDSQGQFNQFVITIRDQYESKVSTFRQVIEVHRADLLNSQNYWENTVKSLKEKNKTLLQEKRKLLMQNKEEFAKLEKEKITIIKNLTNMLDEKHNNYLVVKKELASKNERVIIVEKELDEVRRNYDENDVRYRKELLKNKNNFDEQLIIAQQKHEEEMNEIRKQLEKVEKENTERKDMIEKQTKEMNEKSIKEDKEKANEVITEENRILKSEIENVKNENGDLKKEMAVLRNKLNIMVMKESDETDGRENIEKSETEKSEKVEIEASISNEELNKLNSEIMTEKERSQNLEEQIMKYKEKIENMEEKINGSVGEKMKLENQLVSTRQDLNKARARSETLHFQLEGLLATVSENKDSKETESTLMKAMEDKSELMVEVERLREEVNEWEEKYKKENESEDSSEEYQKLVEKLSKKEESVQNHDNTIAIMTMLKEGTIPDTLPAGAGLGKELGDLEEKYSELEDERNLIALELEKLKSKYENVEMTLKEKEGKIEELESELEDVRQELIDTANLKNNATQSVDTEHLSQEIMDIREQLDQTRSELEAEKNENNASFHELQKLKNELSSMKEGSDDQVEELKAKIIATKKSQQEEINVLEQQLKKANETITELEKQLRDNLPLDVAKELENCQAKVNTAQLEKITITKDILQLQATNSELRAKVDHLHKLNENNKQAKKEIQENSKKARDELENKLKSQAHQVEAKHKKMMEEQNKKMKNLQHKIKELESVPTQKSSQQPVSVKKDTKGEEKLQREKEKLQSQVEALKKASMDDQQKIKQLEKDMKEAKTKPAGGAEDRIALKKTEKQLKELTKQLDMEKKKNERNKENIAKTEEELKEIKKNYDSLSVENKSDKAELAKLGIAAKEGLEAQEKLHEAQSELKKLHEENKTLTENYNSERILRKKYYNMVEDMKGKIRVYCRSRPLSKSELERGNHSVIKSPDEYSISVQTSRGLKEFQFDQVFTADSTQEKVFEDTYNLVQSAVDGYNVCIFAYGQTGSGKTFTMIGDRDKAFPGIAPRAMERIFILLNENKSKFSFKVSVYMMELYNDRLIDLLSDTSSNESKMEIKKDKKGMVFVNGAKVQEASTSENLYEIFENGSQNRHIASTKMNAESSRSHLILSIIIETTNKTTGSVLKGKLSLVDLAGSERASKTEASAEQLKEAQSINKSLSALGDVISALSSEQSFIPYRNNKLTMLMQDSLGGNAKTLMFVNISPADYNTDETVTSLTYASRVKLITNDASKNSENKEIVRLKGIINKLKKGEAVEDEEDA